MAKQTDVIEPRTYESTSLYRSWIRKIGRSSYRFKTMSRSDGVWEIRVDKSIGGQGRRAWETVHHWSND